MYLSFLESKGVTPKSLSRSHFEKSYIEDWIIWLRDVRKCSNDTCNVRLSSIRVFVKYLSGLDIEYLYLLGESRTVRRKKPKSRLVKGLSREAVAAVLAVPNPSSLIGKRDLVFLSLLYSTAARLDEIRSLRIRHLHLDASKPYVILIGKGEKLRTAYLLPKIVRLLQLYIDAIHGNDPDPDAYLFYSRVGGPHVRMSEAALDKRIKRFFTNTCGIASKSYPAFLVGMPRATRAATAVTNQTAQSSYKACVDRLAFPASAQECERHCCYVPTQLRRVGFEIGVSGFARDRS